MTIPVGQDDILSNKSLHSPRPFSSLTPQNIPQPIPTILKSGNTRVIGVLRLISLVTIVEKHVTFSQPKRHIVVVSNPRRKLWRQS
jgi:hypothetical protein